MKRRKSRPNKSTAKNMVKALKAYMSHQELELTTPEARQADELQGEGDILAAQGYIERSHEVLLRALETAQASRNERSIARAQYNLAESYKRRVQGLAHENLMQAHALLEQALDSPARKEDVFRYAQTLDSLAQVKRRLVQHSHLAGSDAKQLVEATALLEEACKLTQCLKPIGLAPAAQYFTNLGNVLMDRRRYKDATGRYRRSLELYEEHERCQLPTLFEPPADFEVLTLMGLASSLDHKKCWEEALACCSRARRAIDQRRDIRIDVTEARVLIGSEQPELVERGRNLVASLRSSEMEDHMLHNLAHLSRRAGDLGGALVFLQRARNRAFEARQGARADHVADYCLVEAQRCAKQIAKVHASRGKGTREAVASFLALENNSSLRYHDMIAAQAYFPKDAVGMKLYQQRLRAAQLSALFQHASGMFTGMKKGDLDEIYSALLEGLTPPVRVSDESVELMASFNEELRQALEHSNPLAELEIRSRRWSREVARFDYALKRHDEAYGVLETKDVDTSSETLAEIVRDHPGAVFVRVCSIEQTLLVSAVWSGEEGIEGKVETFPFDLGSISLLVKHAEGDDLDHDGRVKVEAFFKSLSLFEFFDGVPCQTLYLLPSLYTSIIPWGATGVPGKMLVDRFEAIIFLPMLTPLVIRQAWSRPRDGSLLVAPGKSLDHPTLYHQLAFEEIGQGEEVLFEEHAIREQVNSAAENASVVAFYTHGQRSEHYSSVLALVDGQYIPDAFDRVWHGCERVELWACQTGVNLPNEFLTPVVDEAFGLDIAFQTMGVRSTIGTFWKVPDLITALIVREYRRQLTRNGGDAPRALVQAQRWWYGEAADEIVSRLETEEPEVAFKEAASALDVSCELLSESLSAALGPAPRRGPPGPQARKQIELLLKHPLSWGGYRFCGVSRRTPSRVNASPQAPLTDEQEHTYQELLEAPGYTPSSTLDEAFERELEHARELSESARGPRLEQAMRVARLYATRRPSARRHNLYRGLAWLHEVLAEEHSDEALRIEAAWLWYELAHQQRPHILDRVITPPDPACLSRARLLVDGARSTQGRVLAMLLDLLEPRESLIAKATEGMSSELCGLIEDLGQEELYIHARAVLAVAEVFAGNKVHDPLARMLGAVLERNPEAIEQRCLYERVRCMASHFDDDIAPPDPHWLLHRHMKWSFAWFDRRVDELTPENHVVAAERFEQVLNLMDSDYWGPAFSPLGERWRFTGEPESPWRQMMGDYVARRLDSGGEVAIVHLLATLALGGDLRVPPMRQLTRLEEVVSAARQIAGPWYLIRSRRELLLNIEDSARLTIPGPSGEPRLHTPSVYEASLETLAIGSTEHPRQFTNWLLTQRLDSDGARTAAFTTEREIIAIEGILGEQLEHLEQAPKMLDQNALIPNRSIEGMEQNIRSRMGTEVVFGAGTSGQGELVFMAAWIIGDTSHVRSFMTKPGDATCMMFELIPILANSLEITELDPAKFEALKELLLPGMEAVLADAPTHRGISVIAPGMLRSIPWSGLLRESERLRGRFVGARTLLDLIARASALPPISGEEVLCLDGTLPHQEATCFGHAVVSTRRSYTQGVVPLEPGSRPDSPTITEVDILEAHAISAGSLRVYARSSPHTLTPTTEGITLKYNRTMTTRNLSNTHFLGDQLVELWACSGNVGETRAASDRDREGMPELVRAFLFSGARAVLDTAWEIPDLTKALVYEAFGRYAHLEGPSPMALQKAVQEAGEDLDSLRASSESLANLEDALSRLDARRVSRFDEAGMNVELTPFCALLPYITTPANELIERAARPAYLAAFRWWQL